MNEIFRDLVVIELASVLAGPAVGMFFSELGAKVVKFENINTKGDITRQWKLQVEDPALPYSAYYCSVNYGKDVIMNDLSTEAGNRELIDWLNKADIVISNFKESSSARLGLDYESIRGIKSDIIYAQLNGYPDQDKVAFDMVLQAETGFLSMCGTSAGEHTKLPVALIDILAAHQLKEGILIALLKKYKTGKGSLVTTSLYESAIASLANQATNWLMNEVVPQKKGTLHPNIAPYGEILKTRDGIEVVLAIGTEKQFENLCTILALDDLARDDKYDTNTKRVQYRNELQKALQKSISNMKASDFLAKAQSYKVPVGEIQSIDKVFESDAARQMILEDKDELGNVRRRVKTCALKIE